MSKPKRQSSNPRVRTPRPPQGAMQKQIKESVKRLNRSTTSKRKTGRQQ